jgi:hypothetical protein
MHGERARRVTRRYVRAIRSLGDPDFRRMRETTASARESIVQVGKGAPPAPSVSPGRGVRVDERPPSTGRDAALVHDDDVSGRTEAELARSSHESRLEIEVHGSAGRDGGERERRDHGAGRRQSSQRLAAESSRTEVQEALARTEEERTWFGRREQPHALARFTGERQARGAALDPPRRRLDALGTRSLDRA